MIHSDIFESNSSNAKYLASFDDSTLKGSCPCKGWINSGHARICRHTIELAAKAGITLERPNAKAKAAARTKPVLVIGARPTPTPAGPLPVKPMLAVAPTKGLTFDHYANDKWGLEVKYDGHRMLVYKSGETVIAWARRSAAANDQTPLQRQLPDRLTAALRTLPDGWFDGELIVPGGTSSDVSRLDCQHKLRLVLFDVLEITLDGQTDVLKAKPYTVRREYLSLAVAHYTKHEPDGDMVRLSDVLPVSDDSVQAIWDMGGEGAIIKRLAAPYQPGKRSPDWVKVKRQGHATLTISEFEAGKSGPCSKVILKGQHQGRAVDARVKVLFAKDRATMEHNPEAWIGLRLVIEYVELTASGSFRHATWDHLAGPAE